VNLFFITGRKNDSRLQYVIRFITGVLGYPFETGTSFERTGAGSVVIQYGSGEVTDAGEGTTIIEIYESGMLYNLEEFEKKVDLFEWRSRAMPILGPQMAGDDLKGWRFNKVTGYYSRDKGQRILIPFDLYANIFYHLSRFEEKWRHFAEETITDHSTSVLARHQELDDPLVDALVAFLDVMLRKSFDSFFRILPWPGGQPFAFCLTHDVDLTRGASIKKRIVNRGLDLISRVGIKQDSAENMKTIISEEDAQVWTYPQLLDLYRQYKRKASFFFLTRMFEGMHFRYNISSRKFRKLIEELQQEGHETGLHSSLKAFDKSGKYSEERQKLEEITGKEIGGLRQHYLRAKFPRLWQMAANAGFIYDTSLGYNYQYGFRAGTCHPFRCYNYKTDKSLPLWEFSLAFFENNLPRDTENPEELIAVVERIIGKTEQYEGMVVGLLHPSNFLQPNFNRLWEWILNEIEKRGAFSATLSEMVEWITLKSKIETRIISGNEISIKKPAQVAIFSVELDEKRSLQPSPDYEFEQISGSRYRVSGSKTSFTLKTG
jgi:peptidoglycan/xylan/chitin deacetylase (PgdA/CDA1 family)